MLFEVILPLEALPTNLAAERQFRTLVRPLVYHQIITFSKSALAVFAYKFAFCTHLPAELSAAHVVLNLHYRKHRARLLSRHGGGGESPGFRESRRRWARITDCFPPAPDSDVPVHRLEKRGIFNDAEHSVLFVSIGREETIVVSWENVKTRASTRCVRLWCESLRLSHRVGAARERGKRENEKKNGDFQTNFWKLSCYRFSMFTGKSLLFMM